MVTSGTSGICRPNGELRYGLVDELLSSCLEPATLIFEAPTKALRRYFIRRLGANVNLANIALADVFALETLRRGLCSDTLLAFDAALAPAETDEGSIACPLAPDTQLAPVAPHG